MKFSVSPTFVAIATMSWPDPEKAGTFRKYTIECRFKATTNDPDVKEELRRKQEEEGGIYGLLDEVLSSVKLDAQIEPVDENDQAMDPLEWVKKNPIAGGAVAVAFWDVLNRDVEAKNSKRSRSK